MKFFFKSNLINTKFIFNERSSSASNSQAKDKPNDTTKKLRLIQNSRTVQVEEIKIHNNELNNLRERLKNAEEKGENEKVITSLKIEKKSLENEINQLNIANAEELADRVLEEIVDFSILTDHNIIKINKETGEITWLIDGISDSTKESIHNYFIVLTKEHQKNRENNSSEIFSIDDALEMHEALKGNNFLDKNGNRITI